MDNISQQIMSTGLYWFGTYIFGTHIVGFYLGHNKNMSCWYQVTSVGKQEHTSRKCCKKLYKPVSILSVNNLKLTSSNSAAWPTCSSIVTSRLPRLRTPEQERNIHCSLATCFPQYIPWVVSWSVSSSP